MFCAVSNGNSEYGDKGFVIFNGAVSSSGSILLLCGSNLDAHFYYGIFLRQAAGIHGSGHLWEGVGREGTGRRFGETVSRAKRDFLANASHELRSPINAITGMKHIAKSASDFEGKDSRLDKI